MAEEKSETGFAARVLGGRATRLELYAIAIVVIVLGFGSIGGAIIVSSSDSETTTTTALSATTTVSTEDTASTLAPETPDSPESPSPPSDETPTTTQARTVTTDARGAELPIPVPADRCATRVTIPNVIGMEIWQVSMRWPTGFPECGPIQLRNFGYTPDGDLIPGGYDCTDGTPLRVGVQDPAPGTTFTVAELVARGTSITWAPCPGVVPR